MVPEASRPLLTRLLALRNAARQNGSGLHLANGARALATQAYTSAANKSDRRSRNKFNDDESSHQTSQTSIYPASRAAQRPRPNAPQLFQHSARRGVGQDDDKTKQSQRRTTSDFYILRNASNDPELKHLYTQLAKAAEDKDAVHAAKLALLIKRRKEELGAASEKVEFDASERIVFLAIMRAFAPHGLLQEAQAVSDDMRSFGLPECIDSLNHLLEAAVVSGRKEAIDDILERIRNLPPPASTPREERSSKLANLVFNAKPDVSRPGTTTAMEMPLEYMQNWNATTFAHLLESACQDHNLEMASLMLASCYRLGFTLPHHALTHTITLFLHSEEPRAAVELADLMEQGGLVHRHDLTISAGEKSTSRIGNPLGGDTSPGQVARRFAPSIWMSILRACAEAGYLPGVELAWSKAVVQGLQTPDDGLLQLILALSAKEGCVQMAHNCLAHIDPSYAEPSSSPTEGSASQRPPSSGLDLQEWHLAPMFEAQCSARDYEGAMNTLSSLFRRGFAITNRSTARISTSIYPDKAALKLAVQALDKTATDEQIGTHIDIVNAVVSAAVWIGDLAQALEIYRALGSYQVIPRASTNTKGRAFTKIVPTKDTFNVLLSGCIDVADYETGVSMLKDLNALKLKPNQVTFERMIMLCLTQNNYQDAFGFIEEAKERDIAPSRKSYEALARKCFQQSDHRWQQVLNDMADQGYRPSPALLREFDLDPDAFRPNPRNRFAASRTHQD